MDESKIESPTNKDIILLTRHIRDDHPDIWSIFLRVGFREYMSRDEIIFIHDAIPAVTNSLWGDKFLSASKDQFITLGLLSRIADGLLRDVDLESEWVSNFISDRRAVPARIVNGVRQSEGWKPIELGWIMALSREVNADQRYWDYFSALTEVQHLNPRERPQPDIIDWKMRQFRDKHCLMNRESTLGLIPLLYAKKEKIIKDISDIQEIKIALKKDHREEASLKGGFNLNVYFEDLNR